MGTKSQPPSTTPSNPSNLSRKLRGYFSRGASSLPSVIHQAPIVVRVLAGLACIWLGLMLTIRPISSLDALLTYLALSFLVSGIIELLTRERQYQLVVAGLWLVAGVALIVLPGLVLAVLPATIVLLLLSSGISRGVQAFRPKERGLRTSWDQRTSLLLLALSDTVFAVLAAAWPDVALLVLGIFFGARTLLFGIKTLFDSVLTKVLTRDRAESPSAKPRPTWPRRTARFVAAFSALGLALASAGLGIALESKSPSVDAFYSAPASVPAQPGVLLKSEPFTTAVPAGARAWRILYTTKTHDGAPTLASGVVLTSLKPATGKRPVIAWAHGTTGFAQPCAPSNLSEPFTSGGMPALAEVIDKGWVVVATDYAGLGTAGTQPYLIGTGQAYSVLDSLRAANELDKLQPELSMSPTTIVWGHSQGGHAALWTGQTATSYAPELKISAVAAFAPASDVIALVENLPTIAVGSLFASYVAAAYSQSYPDVSFNSYLVPSARTFVSHMAKRCLSEPGTLVSLVNSLALGKDKTIFAADPASGPMGQRLRSNIPYGTMAAPLLIAQGLDDPLVTPQVQSAYVKKLCAAGQAVDYRQYAGEDHMGLVSDESPLIAELLAWSQDRIDGKPVSGGCK